MVRGLWGGECVELHHVYITDRGGERRVAELVDLTLVRWGRVRDDISQAYVILQGGACAAQADILRNIEPKRSEMVIYRGTERVWEGPVNRIGWHSDWVEIDAHDIADYVFARPLSVEWDNSYGSVAGPTEVTTRLEQIINYEFTNPFSYLADDGVTPVVVPAWESLTTPANVQPHVVAHHFPNEARTSAKTSPFQMTVGEHLDNYARSGGIDYTVIGRALHIWDVSRPAMGQTQTLTEADFYGEIIVTAYGSDFAAIGFTVAQDGRFGGAGSTSDYYGPWAKIFTVFDEDNTDPPTQADLNSQARRNLFGRNPVPVEVRVPDNSGIRLSSGLTINDLVPGVYMPLLATLNARQMSQMQKLDHMTVEEGPEGETISVTLIPATRSDSDEEP
jgi:hypothetical protein